MKPLTICQAMLSTSGGSSTVALSLGHGLAARGFAVRYCHLDPRAPQIAAAFTLLPDRGRQIAAALDLDPGLCGTLEVCSQLLEQHAAHPFDLFHLHSLQAFGPPAALLSQLRGVPYVVTLHGSDVLDPRFLDQNAAAVTSLLEGAAAVTCVSQYLATVVQQKLPGLKPPTVIPNFLRPDLLPPLEPAPRRLRPRRTLATGGQVLHVSSMRPVKRPELVLAAFALLQQRRPQARLNLVSSADGLARARQLLRGFKRRRAVTLISAEHDPQQLHRAYQEADVLLLTSRFEGFGLVLLEALAHARPVVAAAVGAVPEVLGEDWPWLVHQDDDAAAYAAALDAALGQPLAPALSSGVLQRFDREHQIERYAELYSASARPRIEVKPACVKPLPEIPDRELYRPRFNPWTATQGDFAALMERVRPLTLVSVESCFALVSLARQAAHLVGDFWECGVHQGGSAILLAEVLKRHRERFGGQQILHLFDTFTGMPPLDPARDLPYPRRDRRTPEVLAAAALNTVRAQFVGYANVEFHPGLLPHTFSGHENARIALAHIDVDLYRSVEACCAFIYPRLVPGGVMVFDDYGYPSCPGARQAVDEFFRDKPEVPLVSPTAQALVFKLP